MPRGDRTGPDGMGPMTGRGAGYCAGYDAPGYANPVGAGFGRGVGFGRGMAYRRGFRRGGFGRPVGRQFRGYAPMAAFDPFYPAQEPADERTVLKDELQYYQKAVENLTARLNELEDK